MQFWRANAFDGRSGRGYFTLPEVLATLTLAAIVLPVVMHGFSMAAIAASEAGRRREAILLAEKKITELQIGEITLAFESGGDFDQDWSDYRWTAEVEEWVVSGIRELTVRVEWGEHGREGRVELSALMANPAETR